MYGYQAKSFLLCYYYATIKIVLDTFKDLLCSKLCWYNWPESINDIKMLKAFIMLQCQGCWITGSILQYEYIEIQLP